MTNHSDEKSNNINNMINTLLEHELSICDKSKPYYLKEVVEHITNVTDLFFLAKAIDSFFISSIRI